jgi:hypothetical protein
MPAVLVFLGIAANAFASFSIFEQWPMLGLFSFACIGVAVLGGLLAATGSTRLGAWMVIAGSVIFVPLGLVAIFGARKLIDQENDADFEARRSAVQ